MTDPSGSSCIGIKVFLQAHLVLEESTAFAGVKSLLSYGSRLPLIGEIGRDCSERGYKLADTTKIEDKLERKKIKRAARKAAPPKAERTGARGEKKKKVKKLARGVSKR